MTNKQFLTQVTTLLQENGIHNLDELTQKCDPVLQTTINCYNDQGRNWIFHLHELVYEYFKGFAGDETAPVHFISTSLDMDTLKYMCIFPSSLILTAPFSSYSIEGTAAKQFSINRSFLEILLQNSEYIQQDIFSLLPQSFDLAMAYSSGWSVTTLSGSHTFRSAEYWKRDPLEHLNHNGILLEQNTIEQLFSTFPFLYGARVEDYMNITAKYESHYRSYRILVQKFIESLHRGEKKAKDLYLDMQAAHEQMQIQLEIEQSNLKRQSIYTIVGLAVTCIPFLINMPADLRAILQGILGTVTLNQLGSSILETKKNIRALQLNNPYYVTWKWKQKSSKNF